MVNFMDLPTETHLQICSYLDHPSLAKLCATSHTLHDLVLPVMYTTIKPASLTGTLRLFRRLAKGPSSGETSYIVKYAPLTTAIYLPKIAATHEVKVAITLALAECIQLGYFPNLRELRWPFTYVRRGFLDEEDAARFDEPLYQAIAATYESL